MIHILLMLLAVVSTSLPLATDTSGSAASTAGIPHSNTILGEISLMADPAEQYALPLQELKQLLHHEAPSLHEVVIDKVLSTLNCANSHKVPHNDILTIIDYSLPSSEKRLWVFNLKEKKLMFHTYVSHGIKSGTRFSNYFSNINNSKASSLGVYRTEKAYYGREGLSLRLEGLENSFNGNAFNRYIVMHGGWYMDEQFIKRYGRAGRSWGCPAVPLALYQGIINTIKENSLLVVYYPSDDWIARSRFLNCDKNFPTQKLNLLLSEAKPLSQEEEQRDTILFADLKHNNTLEESDPVVVMSADNYEQTFHSRAPLGRMLRRQINKVEFIALSHSELNQLATGNKADLSRVFFVKPEIIMVHGGYYETQMKIVNLGTVKDIRFDSGSGSGIQQASNYTVYLDNKASYSLKASNHFIRWIGL